MLYKKVKILPTALALLFLPLPVLAVPRTIHIEWTFQNTENVTGYRLYHEYRNVCSSTDPAATSMSCSVDVAGGETFFTLTSLNQDGSESAHSSPYSLVFPIVPTAIPTASVVSGQSPLTVEFDASASTGNIQSYLWTFGDGDIAYGEHITHTFTVAGTYNVSLEVEDETGSANEATIAISVTTPSGTNIAPRAVISYSQSVGTIPLQVTLDAFDSSDQDGEIIFYEWNLGDGVNAYTPQIVHTYTTPGTVQATLTVMDSGGLTDTTSIPISVIGSATTNLPPEAIITAFPVDKAEPLTISFSATGSYDPDGQIQSYQWNFGDGTSGSGISLQHSFSRDAVYRVTLTVKDNFGASSQPAEHIVSMPNSGERSTALNVLPIVYSLLLNDQKK